MSRECSHTPQCQHTECYQRHTPQCLQRHTHSLTLTTTNTQPPTTAVQLGASIVRQQWIVLWEGAIFKGKFGAPYCNQWGVCGIAVWKCMNRWSCSLGWCVGSAEALVSTWLATKLLLALAILFSYCHVVLHIHSRGCELLLSFINLSYHTCYIYATEVNSLSF